MTAPEAIATARAIVLQFRMGVISYEIAEEKCKPYLNIANRRSAEIAKKYNKRPLIISFRAISQRI